ncbi:family 78 glycoside hydrolase catalytic domain [candidate division KSB1 bacterium]
MINALWIGAQEDTLINDTLLYGENPAPVFRKEFIVNNDIHSATLFITAAGYYSASLNGKKTGKNYLDPAWTNYAKRIYYSEYDLTTDVKQGGNCLGVTLGNGFYNPLPLKMWGRLNLRNFLPTGRPVFIAKLKIEYSNGQTEEIITDNSWKFFYGPIRKNNVYLGEVYDAGDEIEGWETVGFDDSIWKESVINEGPGGKLQKAFFPPVQITDIIVPVSISPASNGKYLVDMGVNFTGIYRIHLKGEPGDTISFRFGERIYDNGELNPMTSVAGQIKRAGIGGPGAPAVAWQADKFIFGDKTDQWFSPEFTFHTYRYMEISGLRRQPDISEIEGIALNTNVEHYGSFSCSSELINSIQNAAKRTFLANLISVQSDCPAREKFGYGGDLNAASEAFIYNFDMQDFYRKTIYDWIDAINDSAFIDTAPFVGTQYCGLSWESAFLITQYNLYLYYNDTAIVKELYEMDLKWMEKVSGIFPDGIVKTGLSDHESLEPVPVELTGTSHYLQCARIMKRFADFMGDTENADKFEKLADHLKTIILDKFWRKPVTYSINKQTLFAVLLYHGIIPADAISAAADSLLESLSTEPSGHFSTGIFGTKYILEALSKTGNTNTVYKIVNSTSYPGWGFMIDRGATTIWETWKESDNTYSNCHPMFGSVSEWFYRWLGGIRPDPDYPGFEKFIINPSLPEGLSHIDCSYNSPFGEIVSNWINHGKDKQEFKIKIPNGSEAFVKLPVSEHQTITVLENSSNNSFSPYRDEKNFSKFVLSPGKYTISVLTVN